MSIHLEFTKQIGIGFNVRNKHGWLLSGIIFLNAIYIYSSFRFIIFLNTTLLEHLLRYKKLNLINTFKFFGRVYIDTFLK